MIISTILKPIAAQIAHKIDRDAKKALEHQDFIFKNQLVGASHTVFGKEHGLNRHSTYAEFAAQVPIEDYEAMRPYIAKIKAGESDVLWPGRPKYFAKTSGTTSGVKYIPITKASLPSHINTARNALFNMGYRLGNLSFFAGKLMFLSGSPTLTTEGGISTGRLSGIVNHHVPSWLKRNQLPSYATNCIEDWEAKVDKIVEETYNKDLRLISGIPPWVQMYYERLLASTGKETVLEVFPKLSMFVYGGVNYEPYRAKLEALVGGRINGLETYPASEGFIAFQDQPDSHDLLLNTNAGIFFEFIEADTYGTEQPVRLPLEGVQVGTNYAVIINSNAGLWGYDLGDTVAFTSVNPYRLRVTGRIKHFISAFGEHVIAKEVESALRQTVERFPTQVVEFTVAPQVNPTQGIPYHEWFIEFAERPEDMNAFAKALDEAMVQQNIYYRDLIEGQILQPLVVTEVPAGGFRRYMQSQGKLGGQNKVPRLSNDRKLADALV